MAKRPRKPRREPVAPRRVFHATAAQAGQTLAAALRDWLGVSWTQARKQIAARCVQIHGNLALDPTRRLAAGDVVHLLDQPLPPPPREADLRIRFIDPHVVVVEKPAGMTTVRHPEEKSWPSRRRQRQPTVEECLNRIIAKRQPRARGQSPRVRPVHRLDRETSGLMLFARTVPAERELVQQFKKHAVARRYWALVAGAVSAQRMESKLVRDRGDGRRGSHPSEGKTAITHIEPIESLPDVTWIQCRLETGRTHQIRIHLAELGHPVCGDRVYRNRRPFDPPIPDPSGAPRLALHAFELGFIHPITGQAMSFEMPLPPDLAALVRRIRRDGIQGSDPVFRC